MGVKGNKCKTQGLKRRPTCTADHLPQLLSLEGPIQGL